MSTTTVPTEAETESPAVAPVELRPLSTRRVAWLIALTVFVSLAVYYFVGVDEGMTSLFGKTLVVHEWVHDARHFLGFPCH